MKKLIILLMLLPVVSFAQHRALRIDSLHCDYDAGFGTYLPGASSVTVGDRDNLMKLIVTGEHTHIGCGSDSSVVIWSDDTFGKIYLYGGSDSLVVTCNGDTSYLRSNNPFYLRTGNSNVLMAKKFTIDTGDLNDGDTSEDEALFTIPAGGMINDVYAYVETQFTGGTVSAATVAVGDADPDGLAEEHDILGCGNTTWILEGQDGTDKGDQLFTTYRVNKVYTTATAIIAQFVTVDGNLSALTAGSIDIYIVYLVATY